MANKAATKMLQATHGHREGRNSHQNNHNHNSNNNNRRRNNNNNNNRQKPDGPKREAILDLEKYKNQKIRVKFIGGRQVIGVLRGFDQLMNLVLDDVVENLRDPEDSSISTKETRKLGLVVVRCPTLLSISPVDGSEIIDNPFVTEE